jgi:CBS domain-containing protein
MSTVKAILAQKGHELYSIGPDASVYDAIKLMSEKGIGALIVLNKTGHLTGIVTERDYARKVILLGRSSKDCRVGDVMTKRVLCVTPERSVAECMALMTDKRARHLPVVERKKPIGIVSIGDLVKAQIHDQEILIEQLKTYIAG